MRCVQSSCVEGQQNTPLCVADEHYIATMLNAYGMEASIDHLGQLTYVSWEKRTWHPTTFFPGNVTEYARRMRTLDGAAQCALPSNLPLPQLHYVFRPLLNPRSHRRARFLDSPSRVQPNPAAAPPLLSRGCDGSALAAE